jgi:hypothetical protein
MKTSELSGAALDWAVTKCEGFDHEVTSSEWGMWGWATDWAQGGPLIEREELEIMKVGVDTWLAEKMPYHNDQSGTGPTPLIAAMRCYVASQLGDTIDIPEEFA